MPRYRVLPHSKVQQGADEEDDCECQEYARIEVHIAAVVFGRINSVICSSMSGKVHSEYGWLRYKQETLYV